MLYEVITQRVDPQHCVTIVRFDNAGSLVEGIWRSGAVTADLFRCHKFLIETLAIEGVEICGDNDIRQFLNGIDLLNIGVIGEFLVEITLSYNFV